VANIPAGNASNISFGPAKIYWGPAGLTPTSEVGYIESATITLRRNVSEVIKGTPRLVESAVVSYEGAEIVFTGLEWRLDEIAALMGLDYTPGNETLRFGSDSEAREVALLFKHRMPSGATVEVRVWKAIPEPELSIAFVDLHTFPFRFQACAAETAWDNSTLSSGEKLIEMVIVR